MVRLGDDPRHRDLRILDRRPIARRPFGQWTMVAARITPSRAAVMGAVVDTSGRDAGYGARKVLDRVREPLAPA